MNLRAFSSTTNNNNNNNSNWKAATQYRKKVLSVDSKEVAANIVDALGNRLEQKVASN